MRLHHLKTTDDFGKLRLGDVAYLSGTLLTGRDMAHRRIAEFNARGKKLPFELDGRVFFHGGPIVKRKGKRFELVAIGSTTSARMNRHNALVSSLGVKAIIGKGGMDAGTLGKIIYLSFTGGCAALGAQMLRIRKVHWGELGVAEAVWELEAKEFGPLIVAIKDGKSLYK